VKTSDVDAENPQGEEALRNEISRLQQQVVQLERSLLEAQGSDQQAKRSQHGYGVLDGSFGGGSHSGSMSRGIHLAPKLAEQPAPLIWPPTLM
jgi:hypothetical protein